MLAYVEKAIQILEKIIAVAGWAVSALRDFPHEKIKPRTGNKSGIQGE